MIRNLAIQVGDCRLYSSGRLAAAYRRLFADSEHRHLSQMLTWRDGNIQG